jgi:hypothetical protein
MGLKLGTFFVCGLVFLATTRVEELARALRTLRVPYHFGFTLTLAVRLVPVFFNAAVAVHEAQRCRGLDVERGSLRVRTGHYARLIVPVFLGALRRADHMAMALETRGFNAGRRRTVYPAPPFRPTDALALAAAVVTGAVYVWLWAAGVTRLDASIHPVAPAAPAAVGGPATPVHGAASARVPAAHVDRREPAPYHDRVSIQGVRAGSRWRVAPMRTSRGAGPRGRHRVGPP